MQRKAKSYIYDSEVLSSSQKILLSNIFYLHFDHCSEETKNVAKTAIIRSLLGRMYSSGPNNID